MEWEKGLTEETWPSWTSRSYEFKIDGLIIPQILSNIGIQLDTLRKRQFVTKEGLLLDDALADLWKKLASLEVELKKGGGGSGGNGHDDRVPGLELRIKSVERRLDGMETQLSDQRSDMASLETKLMGRIDAMEAMFKNMFANQKKGNEEELTARVVTLEKGLEDVYHSIWQKVPTMEGAIQTLTADMDESKKQLEVVLKKLSQISNLVSVHDIKIGELEGLIAGLQSGLERLKELVDVLPEDLMKKVMIEVNILDENKADRVDLMKKADLSLVLQKADIVDMDKMNELLTEVSNRLTSVKTQTDDRFGEFQRMYDKKLEALLQWILKQLKKIANKEQVTGGTDIGKVRCLVCDQTVKQATDQDVVFTGSNPITQSLKKLHTHVRPVPFENDDGYGRGRNSNNYNTNNNQPQAWARLPTKERDQRSPSPPPFDNNNPYGGGRGRNGNSPPRDRNSPSPPRDKHADNLGGSSLGTSLPQLRSQQGPIVLPTAFSSSGAMVFLSDQNNGTPMGQQDIKMSAFKEMELRYPGNLKQQNTNSTAPTGTGVDTNGRPKSAPMKGRPTQKVSNNNA